MTEPMDSRQRVLTALRHEEPDRVPYDLASTQVTGITNGAYQRLRAYLGWGEQLPRWVDVIQQLVQPGDDLLDYLRVDTRGLYPLTSHNWNVYEQLVDDGDAWVYHDEWGITHHLPKQGGHWFSMVASPLATVDPGAVSVTELDYTWQAADDPRRIA